MKRRWHAELLALLLSVPLLLAASAAANPPPGHMRHTDSLIERVAMSGSTVVYDLEGDYLNCNRVLAWNVVTGKTTRVSGKKTCSADSASSHGGVGELAIAGKRIAWIANLGGNTEMTNYLRSASLPRPKERQLGSAFRSGDTDGGIQVGRWIGNLVGSGDTLAVNVWETNTSGVITMSELDVIEGGGLRRVASGVSTFAAQAVDSGRIAVLRLDGTVALYGTNHRLLTQVGPSSAKEIALRGDRLLVLTKTKTLEIYNSRSGEYLRSWPVPVGAGGLDSYGGVAIYTDAPQYWGHSRIHALRLATGKDVVLARAPGARGFRNAFLEASGVAYERSAFTLVFIPFKRVAAAVS